MLLVVGNNFDNFIHSFYVEEVLLIKKKEKKEKEKEKEEVE